MSGIGDLNAEASLEIRIEDFRNNKALVNKTCKLELFTFIVIAFPGGADNETEGFVVVNADEELHSKQGPHDDALTCIVSIIDIEGNSKCPVTFRRSVQEPFLVSKFCCHNRLYILEHADELLPDGALTLRCDIYFTCMAEINEDQNLPLKDKEIAKNIFSELAEQHFREYVSSVPSTLCFKNEDTIAKSRDKRHRSVFKIFDYSSQLFKSPLFRMPFNHLVFTGVLPSPDQPSQSLWVEENEESIIITNLIIKTFSFKFCNPSRTAFRLNRISPPSPLQHNSNLVVNINYRSVIISRTTGARSFDSSSQIISLARYEELRRSPDLKGVFKLLMFHRFRPPYLNLEPNFGCINSLEDVFVIDTNPHRFLIPFNKEKGDLGAKLMEASPVLNGCVTYPTKERKEKRIDLSTIESNILQAALYYRETGFVYFSNFKDIIDAYKMAHKYIDKNLLQVCERYMMGTLKNPEVVDQIIKSADPYSDMYHLLREFLERHGTDDIDLYTI